MGKRKRDSDHNLIESSSDAMQCSSGMEILSEEKRLLAINNGELKPCPSVLDVSDSSAKLQNPQQQQPSTANHHQSHGRPVFMKRTRQHFGHHYSRRGSASVANSNPSSSRGKGAMRDEKLSAKLLAQCTELGRLAELRERAFLQPERISPSDDAIPTEELAKMVCWICQKKLVQKIYLPDTGAGQAVILSEVAVIACGHAYHAECLDTKTSFEDKRDPPCPLCTGLLPRVDEERRED